MNGYERRGMSEYGFGQLLARILDRSPELGRVTRERRIGPGLVADFVLEGDREVVVVEVKSITPQTELRLEESVAQLLSYAEAARSLFRNRPVVSALAFPGVLSPSRMRYIQGHGLQVWDRRWIMDQAAAVGLEMEASLVFGDLLEPEMQYSAAHDMGGFELLGEEDFQGRLQSMKCGRDNWSSYQKLCGEVLEYLFCPPLDRPISESSNFTRVNRRDFVLPNYALDGFWYFMRQQYRADYIVVDAKNYCGEVAKAHSLQLANYLSTHGTGLFGMVITRNGMSRGGILTCREQWMLHGKMIITLTDDDMLQMLTSKVNGEDPEILIRQKIEDFRLAM